MATISVWEWSARSAGRAPLLLIGTMRPVPRRDELLAVERAVGENGTIRLGWLPDEAVSNLIASIMAGKPGEDLLHLADGAAGNPLPHWVDGCHGRTERLYVSEAGVVGRPADPSRTPGRHHRGPS